MNTARCLALLASAMISLQTAAQAIRHLQFQSKFDQFQLELSAKGGSVNGKTADLTAFRELLPLLSDPLSNDCTPPTSTPDATVREGTHSRMIYLKQGLVSDGTNCLNVAGDGLRYFPLHRDFLIGSKMDSIALKSSLKVFRQGVKVLDLKASGKTWDNDDAKAMSNWDFIEHFADSLRQFSVRVRMLPDMARDKPRMIVQSGELSYEFYKIGNNSWAVKKPKSAWLEASDDWGFWYDFDDSLLEDRFAPQIRFFSEPGKDKAARQQAMENLKNEWSRNLRNLYHRLLLDANEDADIRDMALRRLRQHPSRETALIMAQFLPLVRDEEQKKIAAQVLKINEPKGPLYNPNASPEERAKVVEYWSKWWTQNKDAH